VLSKAIRDALQLPRYIYGLGVSVNFSEEDLLRSDPHFAEHHGRSVHEVQFIEKQDGFDEGAVVHERIWVVHDCRSERASASNPSFHFLLRRHMVIVS
jgi:hypothetical protein